jgi:tetratricopeptide (TPR) repeat protein
LKKYVEMWNEYLKVYMDDVDGWWELSDIYIQTLNLPKAIYCLEEVLLHLPNNYEIYTKIGDTLVSLNNSDSAKVAVKYYSQSNLIKPNLRSFWGMVYALNIIYKANKDLDQEAKTLLKISKLNLENFYSNSPFKITVDLFFDIRD